MKQQPGFVLHVAYPTFFNENVKPNVPAEIRQEVIELHAVVQPQEAVSARVTTSAAP